MPDTTPTAADLLRQAETYLTVTHDHAGRHDTIGVNLTCAGCQLRTRVTAALLAPARLVLGTTDQQPTTEQSAPVNWQAIVRQRERELKTVGEAWHTAEAHRLALSEALGLGTGAPWDAIRDRAAELGRLADEAQPATDQPTVHRCNNCEGIDPDTCFNNPHRPPEQCPAAEFEDYGQQCQKPVGHELHTFEEQPATDQPTEAEAACSRCLHVPHPGLCQHFAGTAGACQCTVADRPDTETEATK